MSSTWNGSALRTRFAQKYGFSDTTSLARVLEWINETQTDICTDKKWSFLKMKLKKLVASGTHEIDISPEIPGQPSLALLAGGALTASSACYVKVTYLIFDESGKEFGSIESEPSLASAVATPTGGDLSLTVSSIGVFSGSTSVRPLTIYRRIYLKQGTGDFVLAKTIENNTDTTTTITANPSSTIEPPECSMVNTMAGEDPVIELNGRVLDKASLDDILKYDPGLSSSGTPSYYARVSPTKIFIYPKPSSAVTLSYWIYKKPSKIFADTDRVVQMDESLKPVLDAGVKWKGAEYKDEDNQEIKRKNYEDLKEQTRGTKATVGGAAPKVRVVC